MLKSDGKVRYLVADTGKIKWAEEGSTAWTNCTGDAVTTTGVVNTFLRVLNKVFIMNGTDALGYVDISDWSVKHYTALANPSNKAYTGWHRLNWLELQDILLDNL